MSMLHRVTAAAVIIVLLSGTARAQVPGDSPNMNIGAAVSGSRGLGVVSGSRVPAGSWSDHESERSYRETLKKSRTRRPRTIRGRPFARLQPHRRRTGIELNSSPSLGMIPWGGAIADAPQNISSGNSIVLAAPAVIRASCAAVSGNTRSMKKRPVTSLAFMRADAPLAPSLSFACAAAAMRAHM